LEVIKPGFDVAAHGDSGPAEGGIHSFARSPNTSSIS
jgi:hypothetical protein